MESNNKRIAKNSIMLYIRMLISMIVGLYTSRVVLQVLGVEDYGIYGVVGSVVAMMGFINASMSTATSRFITIELGKGDEIKLRETFSCALLIHICIALLVFFVAESLGLWFLCNKLVIPDGRMIAAHWVFQLSIASTVISITQVPYTAVIMAHEKMDIYAYFELLNVSLKLLIVYLLALVDWDKLIFYAWLMFGVTCFMCLLYRVYAIRFYPESHFKWIWNKNLLKHLFSFSGWNLYLSISFTTVQHGRSFIVNFFFGVTLNAVCGIASTVQGVLQGFSYNILQAFQPQIVKSYAVNDYTNMQKLMSRGSSFSFVLLSLFSIPIIFNIHSVLKFWLGNVPNYTASFCTILLLQNLATVFTQYLNVGLHATGNVKRFIYTGTISLLQLPILYILLKFYTTDPNTVYYLSFVVTIINICVTSLIVGYQIPSLNIISFWKSLIPPIMLVSIASIPLFIITPYFHEGLFCFIFVFIIYLLEVLIFGFFVILNNKERAFCISKVKEFFNNNNKN